MSGTQFFMALEALDECSRLKIRDSSSSSTSPKKRISIAKGGWGVFEPCLTFIDVSETFILQKVEY